MQIPLIRYEMIIQTMAFMILKYKEVNLKLYIQNQQMLYGFLSIKIFRTTRANLNQNKLRGFFYASLIKFSVKLHKACLTYGNNFMSIKYSGKK